jgi:hypothetical protein
MATGVISEIEPGGGGGFIANAVNDPDLLDLANSVPGLIGQNFAVGSVNDVAILEFDFIPVSSYLSFKYVFASQEYFAYENTQYNDVFGFFISGPGIVGPYASPAGFPDGSINIATFPSTEANSLGVDMPITISSVNSSYNSVYFVSNQNNGNNTVNPVIDGFTTVFTAEANVICGQLYHIRLAIADGSDTGLSSFVLLEAGSFSSPKLEIANSLNIDSVEIFTNCGEPVTLSADLINGDDYTYLWNTGDTTQSIVASPGYYWVEATDSSGCTTQSDSVRVYTQPIPEIILPDTVYYCENSTLLLDPTIVSGTAPFEYNWGIYGTDTSITISQQGNYLLTVVDSNGCSDIHQTYAVEQPLPQLSFEPEEILICGGNPVEVVVSGTDFYQWTPNLFLSSDTEDTVQITAESSITYTVVGTDTIGCSSSILIPTLTAYNFDLEYGIEAVTCQGFSDGSITIIADNSAIQPLEYSIDGGQNYYSFNIFENIDYGQYEIKVKNGIGCIITDTVNVPSSQPNMQLLTVATDITCANDSLGQVSVSTISGGNISNGYSYTWFNSGTNQVVGTDSSIFVPAGGYFLVVEDDNGCQATEEVSVEQPNPITYQISKNDVTCFGGNDGFINVAVTSFNCFYIWR